MKFAAGWGESLSLWAVSGAETVTPPRLAFASLKRADPPPPGEGKKCATIAMRTVSVRLRSTTTKISGEKTTT